MCALPALHPGLVALSPMEGRHTEIKVRVRMKIQDGGCFRTYPSTRSVSTSHKILLYIYLVSLLAGHTALTPGAGGLLLYYMYRAD